MQSSGEIRRENADSHPLLFDNRTEPQIPSQ
jgi:hypothetical protein